MDDLILAAVVVVGIPAVLVGYILLTEQILKVFPERRRARVRPWLWLLPALAFLFVFLVYPAIGTFIDSFKDRRSGDFVGLANYQYVFGSPDVLGAIKNNILWLVLFTGLTVGFGLAIAILVDRVRYESTAKSVIFIPLAISFVAAGVIWQTVYAFQPAGQPQTGPLNAIITTFGADPISFVRNATTGTFALIIVGVWIWTGFAMVILSAGLKGISAELLEAARVDGANEWHVFRHIILPLLMPTIAVVATTMVITALKAFDIVYVMTNGAFDTEVLANRMYQELFSFSQFGRAAAIAVVLMLAIAPLMIANVRRFREQEALR
ncbi:MAG: carbohydrate ABC transporter permease [Candidatus Limnocylindrales bacterium]|nr:sugar ABC transporter permease [Chloroflexota bacterium]